MNGGPFEMARQRSERLRSLARSTLIPFMLASRGPIICGPHCQNPEHMAICSVAVGVSVGILPSGGSTMSDVRFCASGWKSRSNHTAFIPFRYASSSTSWLRVSLLKLAPTPCRYSAASSEDRNSVSPNSGGRSKGVATLKSHVPLSSGCPSALRGGGPGRGPCGLCSGTVGAADAMSIPGALWPRTGSAAN